MYCLLFKLSDIDIIILFVAAYFIAQYFQWHIQLVYRRLQKLVEASYLRRRHIFHQEPGVYYVTKTGAAISQDPIAPIRRINLATFRHHTRVRQLSLVLMKVHAAEFITEREIRHHRGFAINHEQRHIPDGVLKTKDQTIAIRRAP